MHKQQRLRQKYNKYEYRKGDAKWQDVYKRQDQYKAALAAGLSKEQALAACGRMSRDNARTPMQWLSLIHILIKGLNISKKYKKFELHPTSIEIDKGEIVALIGENGAGTKVGLSDPVV